MKPNYIHEALKELDDASLAKSKSIKEHFFYDMDKEEGEPEVKAEITFKDDGSWKELKSFEEVRDFGEGSKWNVARPDEEGEYYFKAYTKDGRVFVGRGEGKKRLLGLKDKDGNITNVFDVNDMQVRELTEEAEIEDKKLCDRHITLYAEDFDRDVWAEYCEAAGVPLSAIEFTICFNSDDVEYVAGDEDWEEEDEEELEEASKK